MSKYTGEFFYPRYQIIYEDWLEAERGGFYVFVGGTDADRERWRRDINVRDAARRIERHRQYEELRALEGQ